MEGWAWEPPGLENTGKGFLQLLGARRIAHTPGRLPCRGSAVPSRQCQELPHHLPYRAWPHSLAAVQPRQRGPREDEGSCLVLLPPPGGPVPTMRAAWGAAQCPAGPWGPGSPSPGAAQALNWSSQGPGLQQARCLWGWQHAWLSTARPKAWGLQPQLWSQVLGCSFTAQGGLCPRKGTSVSPLGWLHSQLQPLQSWV